MKNSCLPVIQRWVNQMYILIFPSSSLHNLVAFNIWCLWIISPHLHLVNMLRFEWWDSKILHRGKDRNALNWAISTFQSTSIHRHWYTLTGTNRHTYTYVHTYVLTTAMRIINFTTNDLNPYTPWLLSLITASSQYTECSHAISWVFRNCTK